MSHQMPNSRITAQELKQAMDGQAARNTAPNNRVKPDAKNNTSSPEIRSVIEKAKDQEIQLLTNLLQIEEHIRKCKSVDEIWTLIANETRKLVGARQVFVCFLSKQGKAKIQAISSLESVDQSSPFVRWLSSLLNKAIEANTTTDIRSFKASDFSKLEEVELRTYPFQFFKWLPLSDVKGELMGGVLMARESQWGDKGNSCLEHLSRAYSHGISRFGKGPRTDWRSNKLKALSAFIGVLCGAAMFVPVTMSTLAPVSIVPKDSLGVSSPIDGIIKEIIVQPNTHVMPDDVVIKLEDATLLNQLEVARRDLSSAQTNLASLTKSSFANQEAKRELRGAAARVSIKQAELEHARDNLEQTNIRAGREGMAIFTDKRRWIGRPVQVGQHIMQISDPENFEFKIDVPVGDAIVLGRDKRVKFFMDTAPLSPIEGKVRYTSFEAALSPDDVLAYEILADLLDPKAKASLRLGGRGTAQLYGAEVPLYMYLFRKPISALRQYTGL